MRIALLGVSDGIDSRVGSTAHNSGYMRRLRGTMRVGRIHPASAPPCRDAVVELGQGLDLAFPIAGCQEQTSGGPGLTPSRLDAFRLLHHEQRRDR